MPKTPKKLEVRNPVMQLQDIRYAIFNPKKEELYFYKNMSLVWNPNELHEYLLEPLRQKLKRIGD